MDLTSFRLLRRPGLPACGRKVNALVEGRLVSQIASALPVNGAEKERLEAEIGVWKSSNPDPLVWGKKGGSCFEKADSPALYYSLEYLYMMIGRLERFLADESDNPEMEKFIAYREQIFRDITGKFLEMAVRRATWPQRLFLLLVKHLFSRQIAQAVLWEPDLIYRIMLLASVYRKAEIAAGQGGSAIPALVGVLKNVRMNLCDWIAAEMTAYAPDWERLQGLTHMLLALDTLDTRLIPAAEDKQPGWDSTVWDCLHRRIAVLPEAYKGLIREDKIDLVREAKVSDLFIVRSEWRGYVAGEAADIINVLSGESFEQKVRHTREEETTSAAQTENFQSTEESREDSTQTELSREVAKDSSLQIKAEGGVNVSGSYGATQFGASAQFGVSASMSENARQASKIARSSVSRAISKVESRVREERTKRNFTKMVSQVKHTIANKSFGHMSGIYRWVDRIDRYQVFRYPDRLQLEFQIPEPAEYFRYRLKNQKKGGAQYVPEPYDYDTVVKYEIDAKNISEENYTALAARYRAANIPPPPEKEIAVMVSLSGSSNQTSNDTEKEEVWAIPQISCHGEQEIKQGYKAVSVKISAVASPFYAHWRNEGRYQNDDVSIEGFHSIGLSVLVGGEKWKKHKGGTVYSDYSVQLDSQNLAGCQRSRIEFGRAFLVEPTDGDPREINEELAFKYGVVNKLSVDMQCSGAASAVATCIIRCERTEEAMTEWHSSVYDILLDAWKAWHQEWLTEQLQLELGGTGLTGLDATSPARNKEIIHEELKRQVISWLLDNKDFAGADGMAPGSGEWLRYDIDKARETAPVIQFMEQAFEWSNLTYILYPYFWARGDMWGSLADLSGADQTLVQFCRSGSARVVVPARPGFDTSVLHWLMYRKPFMGGALPVPGDPTYVSIAQEIRDLTGMPQDGEPQDSWEARISTALVWLDPSDRLPRNEKSQLGLPPHEPKNPLY